MSTQKVTIKIDGMSCSGCTTFVHNTINNLEGVTQTNVDLKAAQATVQYDSQVIDREQIVTAVANTHFEVVAVS